MSDKRRARSSNILISHQVLLGKGQHKGEKGVVVDVARGWYKVQIQNQDTIVNMRGADLQRVTDDEVASGEKKSAPLDSPSTKPGVGSSSDREHPAEDNGAGEKNGSAQRATKADESDDELAKIQAQREETSDELVKKQASGSDTVDNHSREEQTGHDSGVKENEGNGDVKTGEEGDRHGKSDGTDAEQGFTEGRKKRRASADASADSSIHTCGIGTEAERHEGGADCETGSKHDGGETEDDHGYADNVDIDAMIDLAANAALKLSSETRSSTSCARDREEQADAMSVDDQPRPRQRVRKRRRRAKKLDAAHKTLDSGLEGPAYIQYQRAGGAKREKTGAVCTATMAASVVDSTASKMMENSALYRGATRSMMLKKTKVPKDTTAGRGWFHMEEAAMTDELKRDLQVIKMRNYLDPKRFYKASDKPSKFVQVGTVKEGPGEFFSARLTNRQRKSNLVDELLVADDKVREYSKNEYSKIQQQKRRGGKRKNNNKKGKQDGRRRRF